MIQKIALWALAAWLVYYVVTAPSDAAAVLHTLGGLVADAAEALAAFGAALSS